MTPEQLAAKKAGLPVVDLEKATVKKPSSTPKPAKEITTKDHAIAAVKKSSPAATKTSSKDTEGRHHRHHDEKTSSSNHRVSSSQAVAKTPAVSSSKATKSSPAMPLTPAKQSTNLRPNSITAHTLRAVRKSAALTEPKKIEPKQELPRVHVPNPTSRAPGLPSRPTPVEQQAQKPRPQEFYPATATLSAPSQVNKKAASQPAPAESHQVTSVSAPTQAASAPAPVKKEKKYAPEARVPTKQFLAETVENVGKGSGAVVGGVGQTAKGVTDTVGRTVEGVTGPELGRPVKGVTDGVGKTLTGATDGLQTTLGDTTGALGRGDVLGTVGGVTGGLGKTVGGVGRGLVSQPAFDAKRCVCEFCSSLSDRPVSLSPSAAHNTYPSTEAFFTESTKPFPDLVGDERKEREKRSMTEDVPIAASKEKERKGEKHPQAQPLPSPAPEPSRVAPTQLSSTPNLPLRAIATAEVPRERKQKDKDAPQLQDDPNPPKSPASTSKPAASLSTVSSTSSSFSSKDSKPQPHLEIIVSRPAVSPFFAFFSSLSTTLSISLSFLFLILSLVKQASVPAAAAAANPTDKQTPAPDVVVPAHLLPQPSSSAGGGRVWDWLMHVPS